MYRSIPLIEGDAAHEGHFLTLRNEISAIQVLPSNGNEVRLSPVSKLPQGAEIATCGAGFDPHTIKVVYQGQFYYVFLSDLEDKSFVFTAG